MVGDDYPSPALNFWRLAATAVQIAQQLGGKPRERVFRGEATFYNLPGNKTATGQPFDPNAMAAAMTREKGALGKTVTVEFSKTFPDGLTVNSSIEVVVNDTGPFQRGPDGKPLFPLRPDPKTIIDLTPAAFEELVGSTKPGRVQVIVRVPQ